MSLYERIDHDVSSRPGDTFEFHLVYVVCFVAMLLPAAMRRLVNKTNSGRSIFGEAKTLASNCAASSFMGM
jgi:hypothetical protein